MLPGSLSPQTAAEEAGSDAYAKHIQKAESRFGWAIAQAIILTSTCSHSRVPKGKRRLMQ